MAKKEEQATGGRGKQRRKKTQQDGVAPRTGGRGKQRER